MKKIIVTKNTGEVIHNTEFPSQEWLDKEIRLNSWGKPARWLPDFLEGIDTRETEIRPARPEYTYITYDYDLDHNPIEGSEHEVTVPAQDAEYITEYLHPAEYTYSIVEDFSQEIAALKPIMDKAIYTEAYNVFGTNDVQSMNAFAQSWALKRDNPDYYVADGLIATKEYPGFPLGTPLNTAEKIRAYFTARCLDLIAFDRFRDQKIQEYLVAKAELESR